MTKELFDESDLVAFTDAPSENESKTLAEMGRELYTTDADIVATKARLEVLAKRREELVSKDLPRYMKKVGQDKMGLEEFGVDLVLENFYHANIAADWPEEQRKEAFDYLEDIGEGDLVKCVLTIPFPRYMMKVARWVQEALKGLSLPAELEGPEGEEPYIPDSTVEMAVAWNTLTAWVRGQLESGSPVDLDKVGGKVGYIVKIKERKQYKPKKGK